MSRDHTRALVMGVLNVTPDSFYDGGRYFDSEAAIARGIEMIAEGADIIDVGGESSRPGAEPVDLDEELRRVLPVISELSPRIRVSIDSSKREVVSQAIESGATLVNDISASLSSLAASSGVGWIAMHMQGNPTTMQLSPRYGDVVSEVRSSLLEKADRAKREGVGEIWIDPGIGFGKTLEHNLALLGHLDKLVESGYPVMVGVSRKKFLGTLTGEADPAQRLHPSLAAAVWVIGHGARMVRVHDVAQTVRAIRLLGEPVVEGDVMREGVSA